LIGWLISSARLIAGLLGVVLSVFWSCCIYYESTFGFIADAWPCLNYATRFPVLHLADSGWDQSVNGSALGWIRH
jgi:hypothetical protein